MESIMLTDSELISLYLSGDESALKNLILRHERKIFTYILSSVKNKELAEDLFQDTFVKVINTLRLGKYKDEGHFVQWVMRIANNLKIDYFRRSQHLPMYSNDDFNVLDNIGIEEASIEQKIIQEQIYKDARDLVQHLPQEQRQVLEMRIYHDLSFKEIAEKTNVSINTALGRMHYAIANLRKLMEEKHVVLS
ncbi:MAG: sigma-70 family RNA polymerase sigma factor [Bacteroidales bacterium]|nr:sigma-70 family RNA polymerase sigma factor [Bacteroidales bacterium]